MVKRGNNKEKPKYRNSRSDNSFIRDDDYFYSSQGLRDINHKVDELLAFPSQDFNSNSFEFGGATSNFDEPNRNPDSKLDKILYFVQSNNSRLTNLTQEVSFLRRELLDAKRNIADLQEKNRKLETELKAKSQVNVENIERETRKNCLILSGPELKLSDVRAPYALAEEARRALRRSIGIELSNDQINDCKLFIKPDEPNDRPKLLVSFLTTLLKEEILSKSITRENRKNSNDLFVNEYLSREQSDLFFQTRQLKKDMRLKGKIYAVFTRKGLTAYKLTSTSYPAFIRSKSDIDKLKEKLYNNDSKPLTLRSGRPRQ